MKKSSLLIAFLISLVIFLSVLFVIYSDIKKWSSTPTLLEGPVQYYIPEGEHLSSLAYHLADRNIIAHPKLFIYYGKWRDLEKKIRVGTYEFTSQDTPETIVDKILLGKTVKIKVTLQEGLNIYQISQKLNTYFPKVLASQWLQLMQDNHLRSFISSQNPPATLEGYLYPESYFFDPHDKPEMILKTFIDEFHKNIGEELLHSGQTLGLNETQLLTLASIVEKETGLASEKTMVAAVYLNRLKKHMRLQADPTVIYGLGLGYKGILTKQDLQTPTPYNTYTQTGLPPGPISNLNVSSILAVLHPASTDALYFVARGDQPGHVFSKNLRSHNAAVKKYIRYLKKEKLNEKLLQP